MGDDSTRAATDLDRGEDDEGAWDADGTSSRGGRGGRGGSGGSGGSGHLSSPGMGAWDGRRLGTPKGRRLLALADGTLRSPLVPRPWPELNALHALLGGLAVLSGALLALHAR